MRQTEILVVKLSLSESFLSTVFHILYTVLYEKKTQNDGLF